MTPTATTEAGSPLGTETSVVSRRFVGLAALTSLVCGALLAFLIRNAWFANDDFQNLSEADSKGLTLEYLLWPTVKTRFSPGHRLLDWIVLEWPGNKWVAVMVMTGLFLALATFLAAMFVREITRSPIVALSSAALLGTWVGWVRVGSWWTAAAHLLPVTALSIGALLAIVLWDRRGRRARHLIFATALTIAALSFSVRGVLIPLVAAVILLIATPETKSLSLRGLRDRLVVSWPPLLTTGLAAALFAFIESQTPVNKGHPPVRDVAAWAELMQKWVTNGPPAMAMNQVPFTDIDPFQMTVGVALIAILLVATIRGSRSAWIWVCIGGLVVFFGAQVGWGRLDYLGSAIALDARFREGDVLVACLLIPTAWACSGRPRPAGTAQLAAAGLAALAVSVLWLANYAIGAREIQEATQPSPANPGVIPLQTFNRIKQTLPPALAAKPSSTLVNISRPSGFIPGPGIKAEFGIDGILATLLPEVRVSRWQPDGPAILIGDDGTSRSLETVRKTKVPGRWPLCLDSSPGSRWLGTGSAGTTIELPPAQGKNTRLLTVRLNETRRPGRLAFAFLPSLNDGLPEFVPRIDRRREGLRLPLPKYAREVGLVAWGGLQTCITGASVAATRGRVQP